MVSLVKKRVKGHTYWYAVTMARVDGRPKAVQQIYLGSAERLQALAQAADAPPKDLVLRSFSFGRPAAILRADRDLGFSEAIDRLLPRRDTGFTTLGQALLMQVAGRNLRYFSRRSIARHHKGSVLPFLFPFSNFSDDTLLDHLETLTPDIQRAVEDILFRRLLALGIQPSLLLWDTTNFFTRIEAGEDLPRKGMSKDKRNDRNLVGLGLVVSEENIPLLHETYPGNMNDSKVFSKLVDTLCARLEGLGLDPTSLVAIFDRGNNSQENIETLSQRLHLLGTVKHTQAKDLLGVPLDRFGEPFENAKGHPIRAYRARATFYGREWVVVVAYNEATARKQRAKFEQDMAKAKAGLTQLEERLRRPRGRGRPPTTRGVYVKALEAIPKKLHAVFDLKVTRPGGRARLAWSVREEKRELRYAGFGKHVIFTDLEEWEDERIVRANFARTLVEDDFHFLKDKLIVPVKPIFVRDDRKIRAHVFLCVVGAVFWRYLLWKLKGAREGVTLYELYDRLDGVRMAYVKAEGRRKGEFRLEDLAEGEERLVEALGMREFVPN
jgi:transposase